MAAVQGVLGARDKKEQERKAMREAAMRGEALNSIGGGDKLGTVANMLGGFLGGGGDRKPKEKQRIGGTPGEGMEDALNDVDEALKSFDLYKGY